MAQRADFAREGRRRPESRQAGRPARPGSTPVHDEHREGRRRSWRDYNTYCYILDARVTELTVAQFVRKIRARFSRKYWSPTEALCGQYFVICPADCRVHIRLEVSFPLISKPPGAILFSSSGPLLNFDFRLHLHVGWTRRLPTDSPDRLRIDCGSLLSGIRNRPRRATTLPPSGPLPSAGTNQRS